MKILVVSVCKEKLHELEFAKPIEDILRKNKFDFFTKSYLDIADADLEKADKVIICGTSLRDNFFREKIERFSWLENFDKPVLGICAGMQILGVLGGGSVSQKKEIGFYFEKVEKDFLGIQKGELEVYSLHNYYVDFDLFSDWEVLMKAKESKIPEAVRHREKNFYGVLFHPEVRQKNLILEFCKNG